MTTSADIRVALKKRFPHPEFGIVFEVAQGTGWKANRHLDAMAMGVWPSRGLVLHGIEIKVSRGDWRRELAVPEKAEQLARFCDFFWLAAPEDIIPVDQLPLNWGLLELKNGKLVQAKAAEKLAATPHTKDLLAAVFRAACRPAAQDEVEAAVNAARETVRAELQAGYEKRVSDAVEMRARRDAAAAEKWRALMAALNDSDEWTRDASVIDAVRMVRAIGVGESHNQVKSVLDVLERAAADIRKAMPVPV